MGFIDRFTYTVKKTFTVSAAHFLPNYSGKCAKMHGHSWKITVWCCSDELNEQGMVVDFSEIKKLVAEKLDHALINDTIKNPTAENIAEWVCRLFEPCMRVEVEEEDGSTAICTLYQE